MGFSEEEVARQALGSEIPNDEIAWEKETSFDVLLTEVVLMLDSRVPYQWTFLDYDKIIASSPGEANLFRNLDLTWHNLIFFFFEN